MRKIKTKEIEDVRKKMLADQGGRCGICQQPIRDGVGCLDHSHQTGHIRAVLCRNCNGLEGKLYTVATRGKQKFSRVWFVKAVLAYWERFDEPQTDMLHPTHKTADEKRLARNAKARKARANR